MPITSIEIQICNTIEEAPNYRKDMPEWKAADIQKAVIVRKGTQEGNDTVDLQFITEDGQKFVAMLTGRIIQSIARTCNIIN